MTVAFAFFVPRGHFIWASLSQKAQKFGDALMTGQEAPSEMANHA